MNRKSSPIVRMAKDSLLAQKFQIKLKLEKSVNSIYVWYLLYSKQCYTLNNWVEGLSIEANYPWESTKKIGLKSVNPTFDSKQKKVSIHQ